MAELWKGGWGNANFALEDFSTRGVPHATESYEQAYPVAAGFPGAWAIAFYAHGGLHTAHQFWRRAVHIYFAFLAIWLCVQCYWFRQSPKRAKPA